ncbi:hypothetical protein N072000002_04430 [Clostridium tetani]|uniref:Uncharacterized protein n=1 Tax=Clostridium tetani TaxID=1513 RepID=A0A4Q0V910_CLOTA|nr:hypothetical protein [Clostridium tetani]RXI45100.1 hypothetical protein DP130_12680 [Clostridium tetani]RXM75472.1 hypothetical protein DP154_08875 [Clostridium tetani]RYU98715.1 hypothetical protein DP144_08880 [Clostridium tetani]BDR80193.1 hypothetical protein K234311028_04390 [Clostridium tetani]BDR88642.1 hypothetical protein N072000002_04430 [Clostridium tetani]
MVDTFLNLGSIINSFQIVDFIIIIPLFIFFICLIFIAKVIYEDSLKNKLNPWFYSIVSIVFFPAMIGLIIYLKIRKSNFENYKAKMLFLINILLGIISTILITLFLGNVISYLPNNIKAKINVTLIFIAPILCLISIIVLFKFFDYSLQIKDNFIKKVHKYISFINTIPIIILILIFGLFGY